MTNPLVALARATIIVIATVVWVGGCWSEPMGSGSTTGRLDERDVSSNPLLLEDFFDEAVGYESIGGAIVPHELRIAAGFQRKLVIQAIVQFLQGSSLCRRTQIGDPDESAKGVRSRDFWAVVLQELTGIRSERPIGPRVSVMEREQGISTLLQEIDGWLRSNAGGR